MAKPEMEIQDIEHIPWEPVTAVSGGGAVAPGINAKILSMDPETGNVTRLLKVEPGVETWETLSHDAGEEIYIINGGLIDKGKNLVLTAGMYGCRPPGMKHGPYSFPVGALILEVRYSAS